MMSIIQSPRVWFITGTSTGIGRAFTELVLERGEMVVATARKPSMLDDLVEKYPGGTRLLVLSLDITQSPQIVDAFAQAKAAFGRIDVVVNNAGICHFGEVEGTENPMARAVLETNFWGVVGVTKEAVRFFRDCNPPKAGGRILQISSLYGLVGGPMVGYYVASKFALEGISDSFVHELDPDWNIKITLVELGWVYSEMINNLKPLCSAPLPAYKKEELPSNFLRKVGYGSLAPWKNSKAVVEVCYNITSTSDPPLHFPVGKDALKAARKKIQNLTKVVDQYESWSEGLEEASVSDEAIRVWM